MATSLCPICEAPVEELWRRERSDEVAVCKTCNEMRMELCDTLSRRLMDAQETSDIPSLRLVRRMAHDFFGGQVD